MTALESKLQLIQEKIVSKGCFGLAFLAAAESSGCADCRLKGECEGSRESRLCYEEELLKVENEVAAVDSEIATIEGKVAEKESNEQAEIDALREELKLPRVRSIEDWDWPSVLKIVVTAKPESYNKTFKIIFGIMPDGTNRNKAYNYAWTLLSQLSKAGKIEWSGKAADSVVWK
jgi:hypothetical protein